MLGPTGHLGLKCRHPGTLIDSFACENLWCSWQSYLLTSYVALFCNSGFRSEVSVFDWNYLLAKEPWPFLGMGFFFIGKGSMSSFSIH